MSDGLLGGVLPWVYSKSDALKRRVGSFIEDPIGDIQRVAGIASDDIKAANELALRAEQGDEQAKRQLAESVALNFNPAGMVVRNTSQELASRASQMLNSGATPGRILQETGLVRVPTESGVVWGKQISDVGVELNPDVLAQLKWGLSEKYGQKNVRLGDLLDHPELYKEQPELADVSVAKLSGFDAIKGIQGSYDPTTNTIYLNQLNPYRTQPEQIKEEIKDKTSTLLHEVQHAIQTSQLWPSGGNAGQFSKESTKKAQKVVEGLENKLQTTVEDFTKTKNYQAPYGVKSLLQDSVRFLSKGEDSLKYKNKEYAESIRSFANDPESKDLLTSYVRLYKASGKIEKRDKEAYEKYLRIAGEAQARGTQEMYKQGASRSPVTSFYNVPLNELSYNSLMDNPLLKK